MNLYKNSDILTRRLTLKKSMLQFGMKVIMKEKAKKSAEYILRVYRDVSLHS